MLTRNSESISTSDCDNNFNFVFSSPYSIYQSIVLDIVFIAHSIVVALLSIANFIVIYLFSSAHFNFLDISIANFINFK